MYMKIVVPSNFSSAPYIPDELLSLGDFVRLADKCGLRTDRGMLEFFDKTGVLRPAMRIYYPIGRMRKTIINDEERWVEDIDSEDGEFHYMRGGIGRHGKKSMARMFGKESIDYGERDWLEGYRHEIPSELPFQPWEKYKEKSHGFVPDLSQIGEPAEHYYTPLQIFVLAEVLPHLRMSISPEGCLRTSDSWQKAGENIKKTQEQLLDFYKDWALKQNRLHAVYLAIRALEGEFVDEAYSWLEKDIEKYKQTDRADLKAHWKAQIDNHLGRKVLTVLKEHGVTVEEMASWTEHAAHRGIFADPTAHLFPWIRQFVPPQFWNSAKGPLYLAKQYYDFAERLSWAYNACAKTPITLESVYKSRSMEYMPSCVICDKGFKPNSKRKGGHRQVTCSKECSDRNKVLITYRKRAKKRQG